MNKPSVCPETGICDWCRETVKADPKSTGINDGKPCTTLDYYKNVEATCRDCPLNRGKKQ